MKLSEDQFLQLIAHEAMSLTENFIDKMIPYCKYCHSIIKNLPFNKPPIMQEIKLINQMT